MLQASAPLINRHDYQEMPEGPPYFQVIEGDLVMSPSPNTSHQNIAGSVYRLIGNYVEKEQLGDLFIAPLDVFLGDINVYQPDVLSFPIGGAASSRRRGLKARRIWWWRYFRLGRPITIKVRSGRFTRGME